MLDPLGARIAPTDFEVPLNTGMRLLDRHHHVQTEEEEKIAQLREYYAILLRELVLSSERERSSNSPALRFSERGRSLFPKRERRLIVSAVGFGTGL